MEKPIDRRRFLKTFGAAAAGGLAYGIVDKLKDTSVKEGLNSIIQKDIDVFKKVFRENKNLPIFAQKEVIDGAGFSRHTYVHEYFKSHKGEKMPDDIRTLIAKLIPGLAAEESKFDNSLVSPSGAFGIFQIMPNTYLDSTGIKKVDEIKKSLTKQTAFCFEHLDEKVYKYLNESEQAVPLKKICEQFELDKKEGDIFSALVILNAYNAGQGNMMKIIKKFSEKYNSAKDLPENYNKTGLGLFYNLINTALKKKFTPSYGKDARNYVLKILAGNEILNEKLGTSYGLEIGDEVHTLENEKSSSRKIVEAGAVGIGSGAIANIIINRENINKENEKITREAFLKKIVKKAAILAGVGILGAKIPGIISRFTKEEESDVLEGAIFPDGSVFHQKYVEEQLKRFHDSDNNSLFSKENFKGNIINKNENIMDGLPKKNYVSSGFKAWFQENVKRGKITRYSSERQIIEAKKNGKLSRVGEVNEFWRCQNVKGGHPYKGRNNPSYLALHPKALELLENLTETFQEKLSKAGLDKAIWKIRPKIESLVRDEKLSNGSDLSPHEFGLGIDFSKKRAFDLIYVPKNTFMVLDESKNSLLYKATEIIFMESLKEIDKNSEVIITSESHPPHFHVATKIKLPK